MRQKGTPHRKLRRNFQPEHPIFVDDRGGVCVIRSGAEGFAILKFFRIQPPLPLKEFLLYLYYEKIECTFEVQQKAEGLFYSLCVITRGRDYDSTHQLCLQQANKLRQFFKRERIGFINIYDYLNTLKMFYMPYFLYQLSTLDPHGIPIQFPTISNFEQEIVIESGFDEYNFSIHSLHPLFRSNSLYPFIETIQDNFYMQLHFYPLDEEQITLREADLNNEYKETLRRLTMGLEENSEFQAASYLFNQVGESSQENIEPLLDKTELDSLNSIKQKLQQIKDGRIIGLWECECYLVCNTSLSQSIAIKLGGTRQIIAPQTLIPLACRSPLGARRVVDSKQLSTLLPKAEVRVKNPPELHSKSQSIAMKPLD